MKKLPSLEQKNFMEVIEENSQIQKKFILTGELDSQLEKKIIDELIQRVQRTQYQSIRELILELVKSEYERLNFTLSDSNTSTDPEVIVKRDQVTGRFEKWYTEILHEFPEVTREEMTDYIKKGDQSVQAAEEDINRQMARVDKAKRAMH